MERVKFRKGVAEEVRQEVREFMRGKVFHEASPQGITWSLQVPRVYIGPSRWRSYRNSKSVTGHISRRAAETLVPYTVGLRPTHASLMGARTGILLPSTALFPVTQGDIPASIPNVAKNVTVGNRLPFGLPFATFVT